MVAQLIFTLLYNLIGAVKLLWLLLLLFGDLLLHHDLCQNALLDISPSLIRFFFSLVLVISCHYDFLLLCLLLLTHYFVKFIQH